MVLLFVILIVLACVVMGFFILVQNPKGGGLAGNIAGFSTQFMGVKQTTDVLEKGTWILAGVIGLLSLLSVMFISGSGASTEEPNLRPTSTQSAPVQPAPQQPLPQQP